MKKTLQKLTMFLTLSTLSLGGALYAPAAWAHDKHHHHHHHPPPPPHARYHYYYYPATQVYYSPARRGYYWVDKGDWRFGPALPVGFVPGKRVPVYLDGPVPYVYHPEVIRLHPVIVLR